MVVLSFSVKPWLSVCSRCICSNPSTGHATYLLCASVSFYKSMATTCGFALGYINEMVFWRHSVCGTQKKLYIRYYYNLYFLNYAAKKLAINIGPSLSCNSALIWFDGSYSYKWFKYCDKLRMVYISKWLGDTKEYFVPCENGVQISVLPTVVLEHWYKHNTFVHFACDCFHQARAELNRSNKDYVLETVTTWCFTTKVCFPVGAGNITTRCR